MPTARNDGVLPEYGLFVVLDRVRTEGLTGALRLEAGDAEVLIYVAEGRPKMCVGSAVAHSFAAQLLRRQRMTTGELEPHLARAQSEGRSLQDVLVEASALTAAESHDLMADLSEYVFGSVAVGGGLTYAFRPGPPPDGAHQFSLNPVAALIRWLRYWDPTDRLPQLASVPLGSLAALPGWEPWRARLKPVWEEAFDEVEALLGGGLRAALSPGAGRLLHALLGVGLLTLNASAAGARPLGTSRGTDPSPRATVTVAATDAPQDPRLRPAWAPAVVRFHAGRLPSGGVPPAELAGLSELLRVELGVAPAPAQAAAPAAPPLDPMELGEMPTIDFGSPAARPQQPGRAETTGATPRAARQPNRYAVPEGVSAPGADAGLSAALQRAVAAAEAQAFDESLVDDRPESFSADTDEVADPAAVLADADRLAARIPDEPPRSPTVRLPGPPAARPPGTRPARPAAAGARPPGGPAPEPLVLDLPPGASVPVGRPPAVGARPPLVRPNPPRATSARPAASSDAPRRTFAPNPDTVPTAMVPGAAGTADSVDSADLELRSIVPVIPKGRVAPDDPILAGIFAVRKRFRVSNHFQVLEVKPGAPMSVIRDSHARLKAKYNPVNYASTFMDEKSHEDLEVIRRCVDQVAADLMDPAKRRLLERDAGGAPGDFHLNRYFEAENIYRRGRRRVARKGYREGIEQFKAAVTENPDDPVYHLWLARALRMEREVAGPVDDALLTELEFHLRAALNTGHRCEEAELDLAALYRERGQLEKSVELLQRVLATNPKHGDARRTQREVQKQLSEPDPPQGVASKLGGLFGRRGKKK